MAGAKSCTYTIVIILTCTLLLSGSAGKAYAQAGECDFPLFIQQSSTEANVFFLFDNSGSMNHVMYHDDYDRNVTYNGNFQSTETYYVSSSGWYSPSSFDSNFPLEPSAYLVSSDNGQDARYDGNYLNWIYFNATEEQRATIPTVTRIQVAKPAVANIIDKTNNIRFGIIGFNNNNGGRMVAELGTDKATLLQEINNITGDGWTPLAETMVDVLEYLSGTGIDAPIQYWCQKTFVVVVTDGFPTKDLDVPSYLVDYDNDGNDPGTCQSMGAPNPNSDNCSDHLDDIALYMYENDLRADLDEKQNAVTYTIGFSIDASILQDTADNGNGIYLNAYDAQQLQETLENIMQDIISRTSSGSAVSVVSQEQEGTNRLFRAKFVPQSWRGYLEAFELPYVVDAPVLWEAGVLLQNRDPSSRKIFTAIDGQMVEFQSSYASMLQPYLEASDPEEAAAIIEYTRGTDLDQYRKRHEWKLGDIIDSSPVVVGAPNHFYEFNDYTEFKNAYADREEAVYIGANDGMLHCFSAINGQEKWAFIPQEMLGKLKYLADPNYCHTYFVNLTPKVVDAMIWGSWRTILLGGEREGGDSYFALDITYPEYPYLLWEHVIPELKKSWTRPSVARVQAQDAFVAFFSSGPDEVNGEAWLVALDLQSGETIWSQHLSTSASKNVATSTTPIDIDFDSYDDLLYLADLAGNVWRIDLREQPWEKSLLFHTDQPIQAEPILTMDLEDNVYLYFGTGRYLDPGDIDNTDQQTFYCLIDDHSGRTLSRADLVDQTHSIHPITTDKRGWLVDLVIAPGERVVKPDALVAGVVYFTSFQPSSEVCAAGGHAWLYAVDYLDGSAPDNDDGTENDTTEGRIEELDEGFTSRPVIDIVNEKVIIQSSDAKINVLDTKTSIRHLIVRSWRPLYQ